MKKLCKKISNHQNLYTDRVLQCILSSMSTKICYNCRSTVDWLASRCPQCTSELTLGGGGADVNHNSGSGGNPFGAVSALMDLVGLCLIVWLALAVIHPQWAKAIGRALDWLFHTLRVFFDTVGSLF